MKNKKLFRFFAILILAFVIIYFALPYYLRQTLIYMNPGIEDYTIFNNRTVDAGSVQPWNISLSYNQAKISTETEKSLDEMRTVAYLVIHNDSILYEKYGEGYSDSSRSNSFSVAKSIVSLLIGCAIDEGKIHSIQQPVSDFIPEFGVLEKDKKLKIIHLLTMSSGLNWDESYTSPFSKTTKAYYGKDLKKLVTNLHVVEEPGIINKYLSCNTQLLAMILEKATGKTLSEYASEKLWKPLGAEHSAYWSLDKKDGEEKAFCCFSTNARDFARIGQLILNKGKWKGRQIVSESFINESISVDTFLKDKKGKPVDFYGYSWWIMYYKGLKIPYARGILGQYIIVIPEKNLVIVRLGEKRSHEKRLHPPDIFTYIDFALKLLP